MRMVDDDEEARDRRTTAILVWVACMSMSSVLWGEGRSRDEHRKSLRIFRSSPPTFIPTDQQSMTPIPVLLDTAMIILV